jgi:hypothetical protein
LILNLYSSVDPFLDTPIETDADHHGMPALFSVMDTNSCRLRFSEQWFLVENI